MDTEILKDGHLTHQPATNVIQRTKLLSPRICSVGAGLGIFGGIAFIVFGLMCVLVHAVAGRDTILDNVGALMLIAAIPMMMAGAAFMDEAEKDKWK
ncbi:MAG TPA: hypothetical protein PKA82_04240 [Pyrinomonadaceae bacterium]|nr:hypothetical protein [Pyrinomonadaceae bacterium]